MVETITGFYLIMISCYPGCTYIDAKIPPFTEHRDCYEEGKRRMRDGSRRWHGFECEKRELVR